MSRIVVSFDEPFQVLAVGSKLISLLGVSYARLFSCNLDMFAGPKTDRSRLCREVTSSRAGLESTKFKIVWYDQAGIEFYFDIVCSPYRDEARVLGCLIHLESSVMARIEEIHKDTSCAWAVLSAKGPFFHVQSVNQLFTSTFGIDSQDIAGNSLCLIKPPIADWRPLLRTLQACTFGTATLEARTLAAATAAGGGGDCVRVTRAACLPVLSADDGPAAAAAVAAHIAVLFDASSGSSLHEALLRSHRSLAHRTPGPPGLAHRDGPAWAGPAVSATAAPRGFMVDSHEGARALPRARGPVAEPPGPWNGAGPAGRGRRQQPPLGAGGAAAGGGLDQAYVRRIQRRLLSADRRRAARAPAADSEAAAAAAAAAGSAAAAAGASRQPEGPCGADPTRS